MCARGVPGHMSHARSAVGSTPNPVASAVAYGTSVTVSWADSARLGPDWMKIKVPGVAVVSEPVPIAAFTASHASRIDAPRARWLVYAWMTFPVLPLIQVA